MSQLQPDLVSIVTPAFNSAKLIGATIESVLNQSYQNWEMLIVVDAGTTDNTTEVVKAFAGHDHRIKLFEIKNARGISLSRNKALSEARGQYIAFLDSDDLWLPEKLEKQIQFMKATGAHFSCAGYRRIDFTAEKIGKLVLPPKKQTYTSALKNNLIPCPTVLIDQSATGPLKMVEHAHEDYILWLHLLKNGHDCFGLQEDLARYRIVPNSRSMNVGRSSSRWRVFRSFESLNPLKAAYYFCIYAVTALVKRARF